MAYGFSVANTSGRVMFSTDDNIPVLVGTTPVSVASTSTILPTQSATEFLLLRPQDGESGVFSWTFRVDNEPPERYIDGCFTPIVDGYKYIKAKSGAAVYSPRTSGYGLEVYEDDGSTLIFSDEMEDIVEITVVGAVDDYGWFVYKNPAGENFNNLYVSLNELRTFALATGVGLPFAAGMCAYFDHVEETITIRALRVNGTTSYPWDVRPYSANVLSYNYPGENVGSPAVGSPFFIMRKR